MIAPSNLHDYLVQTATRRPDHIAVVDPGVASITYRDLDLVSNRLRDRLRRLGVQPGDRVGLCLSKSIDAVAAIFGILKCGVAHVPVDAHGPSERAAFILADCGVAAVVAERPLVGALREAWGASGTGVGVIALDRDAAPPATGRPESGLPLGRALLALDRHDPAPPFQTVRRAPSDLAYILYTSGSTGKPKGVMISHENAMSFVEWCSETFSPREDDRFSSHAPFHFDLSVLDIYLPLKHGATLVLINEEIGKDPVTLAERMAEERITCWYSTPSVLSLLAQFGHLERRDLSRLRIVHFAGEVFPVRHLRRLKALLPAPRYFNLFGPTETNVCTWYEVPREIEPDRTDPFPIGRPCAHVTSRVVGASGQDVAPGEEGELWIGGPGVMLGYWNAPERDSQIFVHDAEGTRWYRTGDMVIESPSGELIFRGRRDRMVKKRGFRIELGEIEAALYRHPEIRQAAVVAVPDDESGVRIRAFLSSRGEKLSTIRLKQFCAEHLLGYMIPDQFTILDSLPRTSTDKTDYQALREMA